MGQQEVPDVVRDHGQGNPDREAPRYLGGEEFGEGGGDGDEAEGHQQALGPVHQVGVQGGQGAHGQDGVTQPHQQAGQGQPAHHLVPAREGIGAKTDEKRSQRPGLKGVKEGPVQELHANPAGKWEDGAL